MSESMEASEASTSTLAVEQVEEVKEEQEEQKEEEEEVKEERMEEEEEEKDEEMKEEMEEEVMKEEEKEDDIEVEVDVDTQPNLEEVEAETETGAEPEAEGEAETAQSSQDSDLRRSKRKKFHLDVVAAVHGSQKKAKLTEQLTVETEQFEMNDTMEDEEEESTSSPQEGSTQRRSTRKTTVPFRDCGYVYQDDDADVDDLLQKGFFGTNFCKKCPSRFDTKSGLINHSRLHSSSSKRKFACALCDFSAHTLKSMTQHSNIHKRFGVVSAQISPTSVDSGLAAPDLTAVGEDSFETNDGDAEDAESAPILQPEVELMEPKMEEHEDEFESERPILVATRKSGRRPKPFAKLTPQKSETPSPSRFDDEPPKIELMEVKREISEPKKARSEDRQKKVVVKNTAAERRRKMMINHPDRQCPDCPYFANAAVRLERHAKGHQIKEGFKCQSPDCTFMSRSIGFLAKHFKVHGEPLVAAPAWTNRDGTVVKKVLSRQEKREYAMITSRTWCADRRIARCNIDDCEFESRTVSGMVAHKIRVHDALTQTQNAAKPTVHICLKCGYRAKTVASLRAHKYRRHQNKRPNVRTFYLKELVGEICFLRFLRNEPLTVEPVPKESPKPKESPTIAMEEEREELAQEIMDESFDSIAGNADVITPPGQQLTGNEQFCCDKCPYTSVTASRVARHYEKHLKQSEITCSQCSFSCRGADSMERHERLHNPPTVFQQIVAQVEEQSAQSTTMNGDVTADSTIQNVSDTIDETRMEEPMEVTETETYPTLRADIDKWYSKNKDRKLNEAFLRLMIDNKKGFKCIECPYQSKYRGDMRTHKRRHMQPQEYRCPQCSYSAQRQVSLRDHFKQHMAANKEVADVNVTRLYVNNGIHIGERRGAGKDRIYVCNKCPYVTTAIGCLWRHNRCHRPVPQVHICSKCDYSSIDKAKMDEHIVVHMADGEPNNEIFIKRVNREGKVVASITDGEPGPDEDVKIDRRTKEARKLKELKEVCPKKSNGKKSPKEMTPQPTRMMIERTTRNKNNYNTMVNGKTRGSEQGTPELETRSPSTENGKPKMDAEQIELSHFVIREFLKKERQAEASLKCPDCPLIETDRTLFRLHRDLHFDNGVSRTYQCPDCSFSCFTPSAFKHHIKLHMTVHELGTPSYLRKKPQNRKSDFIPPNTQFFQCNTCNYRTVNQAFFVEHGIYHRDKVLSRLSTAKKRAPPRGSDYQKPLMKSLAPTPKSKHCTKCTFKCTSQPHFIAHSDRHGWNQIYTCKMCDYSDNTRNTVEFHELHHHLHKEHTLTDTQSRIQYSKVDGIIQTPHMTAMEKPTIDEFAAQSGSCIKCYLCDFMAHLAPELGFHISTVHGKDPTAKEAASYLNMGMLPPGVSSSSAVTPSC